MHQFINYLLLFLFCTRSIDNRENPHRKIIKTNITRFLIRVEWEEKKFQI